MVGGYVIPKAWDDRKAGDILRQVGRGACALEHEIDLRPDLTCQLHQLRGPPAVGFPGAASEDERPHEVGLRGA